jgi:pterin-4a-carbinolamine dehydratase
MERNITFKGSPLTLAADGLTENDFIMAKIIDESGGESG